ncbi:MAG: 3-phosphoshikimate 1-carboxyvinyltransferase [Deltaproteobacteria bacterium RBG_13_52_11b]|nr:MAG: 3-phosphoshikimate 1-carboxyvinyltransferase [Deltaproteobacteria bacterium RBG_13_52_11b]
MMEIKPLTECNAVVTLPGSKSYTHRALVVSALADGESLLTNTLCSEDTDYTMKGLHTFGVTFRREEDGLHIVGSGGKLRAGEKLFVGNSGTSMRFLCALAALGNGHTVLDGSERMRRRPMAGLLEGLGALGVRTYSEDGSGYPPVTVESQGIKGGVAKIRSDETSQFLSAVLMVAPYAERDVCLEVIGLLSSRPYVDMTLGVMSAFGVEVQQKEYRSFFVKAGQRYLPRTYPIEGDASNASYFFSAAAVTGGKVKVENFPSASVQGDSAFLSILENMGCDVTRSDGWAEVQGGELRGIEIDMKGMPDLVPTLAVTAAFARGKTVIKDIGHLRFKESDRITALATELSKLGIHVEEGSDWMKVEGGKMHGAEIETYNDHRLAMSFSIAGLAVPGVKIKGERCVDKSFPSFWETLKKLY